MDELDKIKKASKERLDHRAEQLLNEQKRAFEGVGSAFNKLKEQVERLSSLPTVEEMLKKTPLNVQEAVEDARLALKGGKAAVLDLETTGLDGRAEVVEIGLVDQGGNVLMDQLVKPSRPIPESAIAIHGITNEDVAQAPAFAEVFPRLLELCEGKTLCVYNTEYDMRILRQSLEASFEIVKNEDLVETYLDFICSEKICVMNVFAEFYGEPGPYGLYKWQSLSFAANFFNIPTSNAHRAVADCKMTLDVLKNMAKTLF